MKPEIEQEFREKLKNFGRPIVILQTGSKAYGLDTPNSDDDMRGVFIPHNKYLIGLQNVEQVKIHGDCSVMHSLSHYVHKMVGQNPTLLELLYIEKPIYTTDIWETLKPELRKLVYRGAFKPYSAYVFSQLQKMRFRQPTEKRLELVQAHGFDTKYASHIARLAVQCTYLMREHYIPVIVPEPYRAEILKIKTGGMNKHDTLMYCEELDKQMKEAYDNSTLPTSINIDKFEREVYIPLMKRLITYEL